jgi:hypothetical protein
MVPLKDCLGPGDFVKFRDASEHHPEGSLLFGEVMAAVEEDGLQCRIYSPMTSSILTQFSLPPITASSFPVAARSVITEVVATGTFQIISRDAVDDLIFILPLREIESGNVFITGATNLFFVCYLMDKMTVITFSSINYFGYFFIQPLTIRIFSALNTLAFTIKKLMYHRLRQRIPNDLPECFSQVMLSITWFTKCMMLQLLIIPPPEINGALNTMMI